MEIHGNTAFAAESKSFSLYERLLSDFRWYYAPHLLQKHLNSCCLLFKQYYSQAGTHLIVRSGFVNPCSNLKTFNVSRCSVRGLLVLTISVRCNWRRALRLLSLTSLPQLKREAVYEKKKKKKSSASREVMRSYWPRFIGGWKRQLRERGIGIWLCVFTFYCREFFLLP